MRRTKKTTITVQKERLLVITPLAGRREGWCDRCGSEVTLMRVEEAAITADISLRGLFRRIEAGALHFSETGEGEVLVCLNSLLQSGDKIKEAVNNQNGLVASTSS